METQLAFRGKYSDMSCAPIFLCSFCLSITGSRMPFVCESPRCALTTKLFWGSSVSLVTARDSQASHSKLIYGVKSSELGSSSTWSVGGRGLFMLPSPHNGPLRCRFTRPRLRPRSDSAERSQSTAATHERSSRPNATSSGVMTEL